MKQELFNIIKASLWGGEMPDITPAIHQELQVQTVEGLTGAGNLKYIQAAHFVWMVKVQNEALHVLQGSGIPVVVIKGTASGIYYPQPFLRTYGDIDLLVQPEYYAAAIQQMRSDGWLQEGEVGSSHTELHKDGFLCELHQSPPGMDSLKEGGYILSFLRDGFANIQEGRIAQPVCIFPMLPWQQNGLELIWHFREHLYNGIGLRHAIDWMMFVNAKLHTQKAFETFCPVLEKAGLLMLAKSVARMCQIYLGLDEEISWCRDVDDSVCADLMDFILEQGNFGHKRNDDKAAKVMTMYRSPLAIIKGMQRKGLNEWELLRKHPALRPFAWVYSLRIGSKLYLRKSGIRKFREDRIENRRRREMFDRLYGER